MNAMEKMDKLAELMGIKKDEDIRVGHPAITNTLNDPENIKVQDLAQLVLSNNSPDSIKNDTTAYKLRKGFIDVSINPYTGLPTAIESIYGTIYESVSRRIDRESLDPGAVETCGNPTMDAYNVFEKRRALEAQFAAYAQGSYTNLFMYANAKLTYAIMSRFDKCTVYNIGNRLGYDIHSFGPLRYSETDNDSFDNCSIKFFDYTKLYRYLSGTFTGESMSHKDPDYNNRYGNLIDLLNYMSCSPNTLCMMLLVVFSENFNRVRESLSANFCFAECFDAIMELFNYEQDLLLSACENNVYMLCYEAKKYHNCGFPKCSSISREEMNNGDTLTVFPAEVDVIEF